MLAYPPFGRCPRKRIKLSRLYNNASEVVREGLRLLMEHDEIRLKWREQIERGWLQAQRGELVDGNQVFDRLDKRLKARRTRGR